MIELDDVGDEEEEVEAIGATAESPEGGFGNLIQKGEEGEDGEDEQDDEGWDDFKWANVSVRASGAGEIIAALLQNIEDEGENPGEFETATETDIFRSSRENPDSKTRKIEDPDVNFVSVLEIEMKFEGFGYGKNGKKKTGEYKGGTARACRVFLIPC